MLCQFGFGLAGFGSAQCSVLRSFLALRGWIHRSNNEDLSKRLCLFSANKTLPWAYESWARPPIG